MTQRQAHESGLEGEPNEAEAARRFFEDVALSRWLPPGVAARDAVAVVLVTLLRRVTGGQARDFIATLPAAVHEVLRPSVERPEAPEGFNLEMYLRRIGMVLGVSGEHAERLVRDILLAMQRHLRRTDTEGVAGQLPEDLGKLWQHP